MYLIFNKVDSESEAIGLPPLHVVKINKLQVREAVLKYFVHRTPIHF